MADTPYVDQHDLFVSGTEGYHTFRIPSLIVTTMGTVLAFCEGRRHGRGDSGEIDMVMKRSVDGGQTWTPLRVIWHDEGNTCGNPCPVVDRETGTVWLLMTHNLGRDDLRTIVSQQSDGSRTVWLTKSRDDGVTWAAPVEITATTKLSDWTWYATGPGAGIQLRSGRLVVPCDHRAVGTQRQCSHVIYSDDRGETWHLGGSTPDGNVDECEVVELVDGALLLNMRNDDRAYPCRAIATSHDRGDTWSAVSHDTALIEPVSHLHLSDVADKLLQCTTCGGAFYGGVEAPAHVKIKKGVLIVDQDHGSREVTSLTYRFRYEPDTRKFALIGFDFVSHDRATAEVVSESTNYLTGVRIVTRGQGRRGKTVKTRVAKEKIDIERVDSEQYEIAAAERLHL